jgi:AcrR family transcriptional regulator
MSPQSIPAASSGLRALKKRKTRRAIEEAAAALFKKLGYEATTIEQIAKRAEVSKPTFFRYFRSKADILLNAYTEKLPAVREAIVNRPAQENDLMAARCAFLADDIELDRNVRLSLAVMSSSLEEFKFGAMNMKVARDWLSVIAGALAERRGLDEPCETCLLSARVISATIVNAVECWIADGCKEHLNDAVARNFDAMSKLQDEWRPRKARK